MKVFNRTPGRNYFISMFVIGSALFITFSTVIYRRYDDSVRLNNWVVYNYELARRARMVQIDLLNMETGVRGYLLTGKERFLDTYYKALKTLPGKIDGLRDFKAIQGDTNGDVADWVVRIQAFQKLLDTQVQSKRKLTHTNVLQTLDRQKAQMDALRTVIEANIATRIGIVSHQVKKFQSEQRRFLFILILGTVLATLAMLFATMVILGLITRSKRVHREVELAEERFRVVMNGLGDGVYDLNPITQEVYYSPAYYEMLGYTASEFPQEIESAVRIMHADDAKEVFETLDRYARHEIPVFNVAFRMLHKDGSWRWMLSRGVGFWNKQGELERLLGTHSDISEQKQREEELSQLNSELETYTYIASHDLRSPLVNLKGFARELAVSVAELTPVIKRAEANFSAEERSIITRALDTDMPEAIDFIIQSSDRMDRLTTAVLDLSRIGRREYARLRVDVQAIVQKCIDGQAYEISRNNIEVTVDPLPHIFSDSLALEQIFTNLLDNAIKYMQPGRPGKIKVQAHETPSDVIFEVIDNGRGIAPQDLSKVFEIFRRARNTDNVRGQGMGMAFVKATVRKLGGNIWCTSTFGEGTTFSVRLPRMMKKENV